MFAIQRVFEPEVFQGRYKINNYFEGWYFLQVSEDQKHSIAVIPGVSLDKDDPHAFIQVILSDRSQPEGSVSTNEKPTLITDYFRFPLSDFKYEDKPFSIKIGGNSFSKTHLDVDLERDELHVKGVIKLGEFLPIHKSLFAPNIMGFFGYLSFMECYHGIVSMGHTCTGEISINGIAVSYKGGTGYIEKDWGCSFPKEYVWLQGNNFKEKNTAIMLSVAHIPFLWSEFRGFICNLNIEGKEYRWATYNRSKIISEDISEKNVRFKIKRKDLTLLIEAEITENANLIAPKNGQMKQTIKEGLFGEIRIKLIDKGGKMLYNDISTCAGVEIVIDKSGHKKIDQKENHTVLRRD